MPRRHILTERQRSALFDLPIDELSLLRHYTLADDDLDISGNGADRRTGSGSLYSYVPFAIPVMRSRPAS